jgi:toxin HigB-1
LKPAINQAFRLSTLSGFVSLLAQLNSATAPRDMALPGLNLHPLKGDRKGAWAVSVSGNWRITFRFVGKDADAVDYEDYH